MSVIHRLLIATTIAVGVSACATWTYDGESYTTSEAALEAARQDVRRNVSVVPPRTVPAGDSVLVYTPSLDWSRQAVRVTGAATEEQIRYVASVQYYGFYGMAEAVERRNLFSSTDIREFNQRDPLANPNYEYLLWLRLDGPDSAQWMISPGSDTSAPRAIFASPISDSADRVSQFVESVEQYLSASAQ